MVKAHETLHQAAAAIEDRAAVRDLPNGERSMARCVRAFNSLTHNAMTVEQGWLFMVCLKLARATAGEVHADDYVDAAGYSALALEEVTE